MSRPIIIRNGSNSIINISNKLDKLIEIGNQYHIYFDSLEKPYFDISIDNYGGVVTHKNNPIGVIGVPSSVTGDNSIRVVSLFNMDYDNPESGTTSSSLLMRNASSSFLNYVSRFTGPYKDDNNSLNSYTLPFVDGWHDQNVLIELADYLGKATSWRTSSSVPHNDEQNRGYSPAALCAWRYNPIQNVVNMLGYWYLPSMHELIEEANHLTDINAGAEIVKNTYNVGIGRIPYDDSSTYNNNKSYWESTFIGKQSGGVGGNSGKYNIKFKRNRSRYYATSQDSGIALAWCKLIKENGKWILDPSYHID